MEAIYIPLLLKAASKTREIKIDEFIPGLDSLTPVRGILSIAHGGNYLEVRAAAETIITQICDRCLANYNHRLSLETREIIWLDENADKQETLPNLEKEVLLEDLSEKLHPRGYFEPDSWLYEQLSLAMPLQKLCGTDCQGTAIATSDTQPVIDSRWATLAALKKKLSP